MHLEISTKHVHFEQEGIFEMDYQMRLKDRSGGGGCVSREEYVGWRMSGDAFPFDEDEDDDDDDDETRKCRNPTLVSSVMTRERRSPSAQ